MGFGEEGPTVGNATFASPDERMEGYFARTGYLVGIRFCGGVGDWPLKRAFRTSPNLVGGVEASRERGNGKGFVGGQFDLEFVCA